MCIPLSQKWYTDIRGRELLCNREFQDENYKARVPREERPARSQRQGPHRRGEEGAEEAQLCSMAPEDGTQDQGEQRGAL